ncbi:MAG: cysteine desulfurase [Bacilli bacterium]|jgi:cysteine desulfurase|nr:cysteine desulfurase [Bacilli bacterium]
MIYFDNAATTEALPSALRKFAEVSATSFGNPSSNHAFGHRARRILDGARVSILGAMGLKKSHELVFTSGATESNNLALKGVAFHYAARGKRIITSAIEHPSVLAPLMDLRDHFGYEVVILPVNGEGVVTPEELAKAMDGSTILVSLMAVNNEIGSIFDTAGLSAVVHKFRKAFFHVDATQAICKTAFPYGDCDLISYSGHKFGGLKGTGALVYRQSIILQPQNEGGGQEHGYRAGTSDVAGDAAMALAQVEGLGELRQREAIVRPLNEELRRYFAHKPGVLLNSPVSASPYLLNISLTKKKASVVVEALSNRDIYVSSVSACSSKRDPFSYVVDEETGDRARAQNSIRISFSPLNTMDEVKTFEKVFDEILQEVKDR